jgi:hypothetical protein
MQINLSQLYSHTSDDIHSDASELMATCACPSKDRQLNLLIVCQIWRDLFLGVSLAFVVIHGNAEGRDEVDALEQGGWSGGGGSGVIS